MCYVALPMVVRTLAVGQCAKNGQSLLPVQITPCIFVQLFKLLSAKGVMQLASRSERKINIVLPLKKKAYINQYQWCQLPV